MTDYALLVQRRAVERAQKWDDEIEHIPFIQFPADWQVQVIPPVGDAVVRFRVKLPSGNVKSIYLDVRESLGCGNGPYWEVYPYQGGTFRCRREEVAELLQAIGDDIPGETL